jgi:hypothetical protein
MRTRLLIPFLLILTISWSCTKDDPKQEANGEKNYYDILGSGTGWKYVTNIRLVNPMWGWFDDHEFRPIALKAFENQFELYAYSKIRAQQDYQYNYKIFTFPITGGDTAVESIFNYQPEEGFSYLIFDETKDYFLTETDKVNYYVNVLVRDKNRNLVFAKNVFAYTDQNLYTPDGRLFFMGNTLHGCEFKYNDYEGIDIYNTIADSAMVMRSLYYQPRTELQELFVSENGYLCAAVMQKEISHDAQNNTKMISVAYTRTFQCDSSAIISLCKRAVEKYYVTVYSGRDAKICQYIYDPDFYTFETVYENKSAPGNLSSILGTSTGLAYLRTTDQLFKTTSNGSYAEISLAIFKPDPGVDANVFLTEILVCRDRLFGLVMVQTGFPDPPQISVIEHIEE